MKITRRQLRQIIQEQLDGSPLDSEVIETQGDYNPDCPSLRLDMFLAYHMPDLKVEKWKKKTPEEKISILKELGEMGIVITSKDLEKALQ